MTKEEAIKRDLISRAEVAEISEAMLKTVTDQKIKIGISRLWQQIKDLPSADRPRGEQYKKGFEDAKRAFLIEYARESQNLRKRNAQLEVMLNAQKAISADRQRGEWIYHIDDLFPFESTQECSNCNKHQPININDDDFCPACGADMRGEERKGLEYAENILENILKEQEEDE